VGASAHALETVTLRSPAGELEATFLPAAAMICTSLRHRDEELLHLGDGVDAYLRDGTTVGVPLLHPWANRLAAERYDVGGHEGRLDLVATLLPRDRHGQPIHGLVVEPGAWSWEQRAPDRLRACIRFGDDPLRASAFPFPHSLAVEATLRDEGLTVVTTLAPSADVAVPVSYGFHPYLRLPGVPRERWRLELPAMRRVRLSPTGIPLGGSEAIAAVSRELGERTLDDGYVGVPAGAELAIAGGGRRVAVRMDGGYPCAQVYAPAGEAFVCLEPMTAPANALASGDRLRVVAPGETQRAAFTILVEAEGETT
jgi:aldose 1-epimerase